MPAVSETGRARRPRTARSVGVALAAALGLASSSFAVADPAPGYDGWSWLLWGRELAAGELDTRGGPAFKPLTVAVCALLAPLGDAAPWAWALVVRASALFALWLAFGLGRELSGGSVAGGVLAGVAVAACDGFLAFAASGAETAPLIALGLGAAAAWRSGRPGPALACAAGCALLRVEAWPFAAGLGALVWRERPRWRPALAGAAFAVPALWLVPEWVGSGDPLRSGERARIPNPGAAAEAEVPFLAALVDAAALPLWPLWAGAGALLATAWRRRRVRGDPAAGVVAAGLAWIILVAAMAQAGFSGEARYALPGAALVALGSAVGLVRLAVAGAPRLGPLLGPRVRVAVIAAALALALGARLGDVSAIRSEQAYQWRLATQLERVIEAAGGRDRVLGCGRPFTGPLRGPLLAYRLGTPRSAVEPDAYPRPPGTVFRSARVEGERPAPDAPPAFAPRARSELWRVLAACRS